MDEKSLGFHLPTGCVDVGETRLLRLYGEGQTAHQASLPVSVTLRVK